MAVPKDYKWSGWRVSGTEWGNVGAGGGLYPAQPGVPPPQPVLPNVSDVPGPLFIGRFAHSLDDKRRIALPKTFRDEIEAGRDGETFFLVPGLDPCLWLFTQNRFSVWRQRLGRMLEAGFGQGDQKVRALRRDIFSGCTKLTPDKQGRIALPQELCKRVGIDKDVVFLGVDEKVELWSPAAEEVRDDPERLRRLAQELIG